MEEEEKEWRPGLAPRFRSPGEWGIEPVTWDHRRLGFLDYAVLWGDLSIGLLVLLAGSVLVPALGLRDALAAILLGSILGCLLLGLAGLVGSDTAVPTMVLLRPVLGVRGSYVPTVLNLIQLVGWGTFEIVIMAQAADGLSRSLFGFSGQVIWVLAFGGFCTLLAIGGPVAVVRHWLEKFAVWLMLGTTAWITYRLATRYNVPALFVQQGKGGLSFWTGVDLVVAMPVSWLPLVADYSRFASSGRRAFWGTTLGTLVGNVWFYGLGALLVLALKTEDLIGAILGLAGGWVALAIILVDETDEAFADIYSAALSLQNIFPRAKQRWLALGIGLLCTALATRVPIAQYESFLLLIGSVFVPLFGVLAADYFVARRRTLDLVELFRPRGAFRYQGGVRWWGLVAWAAGVATYHLIPLVGAAIGSSLPSFAVAFALMLCGGWLGVEAPAPAPAAKEGQRARGRGPGKA